MGLRLEPEDIIREDARRDHARASDRGRRIFDAADAAIGEAIAVGLLPATVDRYQLRLTLMHALADVLFPNAAVDLQVQR